MNILIVGDIEPGTIKAGNQEVLIRTTELLISLGHNVTYLYVYKPSLTKTTKNNEYKFSNNINPNIIVYKVKFVTNVLIKIRRYINDKYKKGFCKIDDYYPYGLANYINKLNKQLKFDCCIINYFYFSKLLNNIKGIKHLSLMTHDSFIYRNIINGVSIPALTPSEEAKALKRAPYILSLQDIDSYIFHRLSPFSKIYTVYMPLQYHETAITGNHNILFYSGSAPFNIMGIKWFIREIMPALKQKFEDINLIIGGSICKNLDFLSDRKDITLYGYVEDEQKFFKQGDIAINPINHGSGLKIKTLKSLAYDKITISTPHSAEGLFNEVINSLIIPKNDKEWIDMIVDIWNNPDSISQLKNHNKKFFSLYNSTIKEQFQSLYN